MNTRRPATIHQEIYYNQFYQSLLYELELCRRKRKSNQIHQVALEWYTKGYKNYFRGED